jgi:hypothetical protein
MCVQHEHWQCAKRLTSADSPLSEQGIRDWDLDFAADMMFRHRDRLHEMMIERFKPLAALAARLEHLSDVLRRFQRPQVHSVTRGLHMGLLAVAVVLLAWSDWRLPLRYVTGFASLGTLENTSMLRPVCKPA